MVGNPKVKRIRDRKYLDRARDAECEACGSDYGVVSAHVRDGNEGGMGLKPSDDLTVCLCYYCHAQQESNRGSDWWFERVFKQILRKRYEEWKDV